MKYPTDPKISEKLAYLVRELEGVHKRLNSVVASNRTVYGNGGVGGRLSGLSGKLGNLSASLDNSAATLRLAAEEFAKKEQEQKGKAATAAESAKNGVNITWVGTAVAAAVLGTTTVVKKSVGLNLSSVVKDAIDSVVKGSDEKAAISVTQSKYIDGQKYDAKEVRASIADLEKAQAEYKEKYGEESRAIRDEIARLNSLLARDIPPFYSNQDSSKWGNGCFVNSYAMIFQYKGKNITRDKIYLDNGNKVFCRYRPDGMIKAYGFVPQKAENFPKERAEQEVFLKELLKTEGAVLLEMPSHMAVAYLDADGNVRVQDPGYKSKAMVEQLKQSEGKTYWSGENISYSTFLSHWNGKNVGTVWCVHST